MLWAFRFEYRGNNSKGKGEREGKWYNQRGILVAIAPPMATILFYEKPGCINNTKQKALLKSAGHEVQARNLLTEPWTVERLRLFFGDRPIAHWFNRSAPAVKSEEVIPEQMQAEEALARMVQEPLLIRRPLMQVIHTAEGDSSERRMVGFDVKTLEDWIGLQPVDVDQQPAHDALKQQDLQTCPRLYEATPCSTQV